jgi:hypothetical protein
LFVEKCGSSPEDYENYTEVPVKNIDKTLQLLFDVSQKATAEKSKEEDSKALSKRFETHVYKFED